MKKILSNKLYMTTFVADMVSNFGDVLYYLALMNYVLDLKETSQAMALVTASESLPILGMLFMGVWADKTRNKIDAILTTLGLRVGLYALLGVFMGFSPALWVVLAAVLVNLVSDLSGQYESALFNPLSLRIIPDEDRESFMAFRQGVSSFLRIIFQSSGALFIAIMSYQQLAFFNAGTFLFSLALMLVIRPSLNKLLENNPLKIAEQTEEQGFSLFGMFATLKKALETVKNIPVLGASMVIITGLNAIFVALSPLMILSIKENPNFIIINQTTTIAAFSIVLAVGSILGSILVSTRLKDVSFIALLQWSAFMPLVLFVGFYLKQIYLVFGVVLFSAILLGLFNPKINALVMRNIPEEQMGTVGAGIDSLAQGGMIVSQLFTAVLVANLPVSIISIIFFLLALVLFGYTIRKTHGQSVK